MVKNEKDKYNYVCNKLKRIMKENDIKFYEVAYKIGMKPGSFYIKINGDCSYFSIFELKRICDQLAESIEEILEEADRMCEN